MKISFLFLFCGCYYRLLMPLLRNSVWIVQLHWNASEKIDQSQLKMIKEIQANVSLILCHCLSH